VSVWQKHPATARQQQLVFSVGGKKHRLTQTDVLISMLRKARGAGLALELPQIMAAGIAQHGARMKEIRQRGFVVRNELERSPDDRVLSRYWLECDPEQDGKS
jgi:hypothetical protein